MKKTGATLALLVLALGAAQLSRPGYSVDEEFTIFAVRGISVSGFPVLPSGLLYDRGLAYSYASGIAGLSGSELPAYRAVSLLSAAAAAVAILVVLTRLFSFRAGLFATLLAMSSVPFFAAATTARFYAPFLAAYAVWLLMISRRSWVMIALLAAVCRWTHEMAFIVMLVPAIGVMIDRDRRTDWLRTGAATLAGLVVAQFVVFAIHFFVPSDGSRMISRFFLWQVLNLFERPPDRQFGIAICVMVIAWLIKPQRAAPSTVIALCIAASILGFSLAQALRTAPMSGEMIASILTDGSRYPLDMFWHIARSSPFVVVSVLAFLLLRLAGIGGEWTLIERAVHLNWIAWVLWFGVIESGITINYVLMPVTMMLVALGVDVAAVRKNNMRTSAVDLIAVMLFLSFLDQWREEGFAARLQVVRPTIAIEGIDEIRRGLQPADRVACTDELACLLLVGRVDNWLALDDYVRERFIVEKSDGARVGVYAGAPAVFRPGELFTTPDSRLPAPGRILIVDVFKEYPVGNSSTWLPRALALDGIEGKVLLETPQARVVQISAPIRNAQVIP